MNNINVEEHARAMKVLVRVCLQRTAMSQLIADVPSPTLSPQKFY